MKGGLKVSQISLILIGFICITVLTLAFVRSPFLSSWIPPQNSVFHPSPEAEQGTKYGTDLGKGNTSVKQDQGVSLESSISTSTSSKRKNPEELIAPIDGEKDGLVRDTKEADRTQTSGGKNHSNEEKNLNAALHSLSMENHIKEQSSGGKNHSNEEKSFNQKGQPQGNMTTHSEKRDCNLAKGKWVKDDNRPLYSGHGCKQWLSSMWACRLTQRTDFDYEKLRWKPKDCDMEDFTASKFLKRMENKTLAFIGDSLGRQQFQSLMCMITGGEERPDVLNVGHEYGLVKARGAARPDGWAYRFPTTNTTILYYWSASLCDIKPINSSESAMHLDRPPAFLARFLPGFHVIVLNTGHHWNRGKLTANRWVMHAGGAPAATTTIAAARNLAIRSVVKWVDSELRKFPEVKAFYRSISPRHFFNGDWNSGGTCDATAPRSGLEVSGNASGDPVAEAAVRGTGVRLLDITAVSEVRDEGHISRYSLKATPGVQDCLHWCLPGVPDTWNEMLFAQI